MHAKENPRTLLFRGKATVYVSNAWIRERRSVWCTRMHETEQKKCCLRTRMDCSSDNQTLRSPVGLVGIDHTQQFGLHSPNSANAVLFSQHAHQMTCFLEICAPVAWRCGHLHNGRHRRTRPRYAQDLTNTVESNWTFVAAIESCIVVVSNSFTLENTTV